MAGNHAANGTLPEGVYSILDTDLYKLTMQCAILKYLPDVQVTYAFTNRTPDMKLTRAAYNWLESQIKCLSNICLSQEELHYLKTTCTYFNDSYLDFLTSFRLQPTKHIKLTFQAIDDGSEEDIGVVSLQVGGKWLDTILYEIPLLALISEAYFKFCDKDWGYESQRENAYAKGLKLTEEGCIFSEFGTRRRRDYHTQDLVLQGLIKSTATASTRGWSGKLSGTSNVHFAMRYGIPPVGTVAHEWFMGIASITNDYERANETALRYWVGCFGQGVLSIALTDTFGTPTFLKAFQRIMPSADEAKMNAAPTSIPGAIKPAVQEPNSSEHMGGSMQPPESDSIEVTPGVEGRSYAQTFAGVRQDSGDPKEFVTVMREFYISQGIHEKKTIVFSDSLNVDLCLEYKLAAEEAGFSPTFGIGTFLTNDFTRLSDGKKSAPMNIVIKLSSANGSPAIKISDNVGKNTGDSETVHRVKESLGYKEKPWADGDEEKRWGAGDEESATTSTKRRINGAS